MVVRLLVKMGQNLRRRYEHELWSRLTRTGNFHTDEVDINRGRNFAIKTCLTYEYYVVCLV